MTAPALALDSEGQSLWGMHIPIDKLLREAGMTAYDLANEFVKRDMSAMAAYNVYREKGRMKRFDARVLDVLCDIFHVEPNDLLIRDPLPKPTRR